VISAMQNIHISEYKIKSLVQYSERMWTCRTMCLYRHSLYPHYYQILPKLMGVCKGVLTAMCLKLYMFVKNVLMQLNSVLRP
jgi:uncharacterized membrane protein